jgi:multimeric flavodoxin WrbA
MSLKAVVLNCTLKPSPAVSNTEKLAQIIIDALKTQNVAVETARLVDLNIKPGVKTNEGTDDDWPSVHEKILKSDILIVATPTWVGHPSSIAQRVLERMDAMISETDASDTPVAYNKVAGVVVTGNEDGAHHVISEICGGLIDIGFTIPAQAWTYWNMGPGPGPDYSQTQHGHKWSKETGEAMAKNLVAVATALKTQPLS